MIRAPLGHRGALRVTASVTDRARISEITAVTPAEHRTAPNRVRSGHRSALFEARLCKGIVMPLQCPIDDLLMPTPDTSETEEVTL